MPTAEPKPSLVERLFAEQRGALHTFFLRRIRAKADAAELAQEVYLRMLRVSNQDAIRNPIHYLYTGEQPGEGACGTRASSGEWHRHRWGAGTRAARDPAGV